MKNNSYYSTSLADTIDSLQPAITTVYNEYYNRLAFFQKYGGLNPGFKIFSGYWTTFHPKARKVIRIPYTLIDWIDDAVHEIERYTFHGRRSCLRLLVFSPVSLLIMIYTLLRVTIFWKRHYA